MWRRVDAVPHYIKLARMYDASNRYLVRGSSGLPIVRASSVYVYGTLST